MHWLLPLVVSIVVAPTCAQSALPVCDNQAAFAHVLLVDNPPQLGCETLWGIGGEIVDQQDNGHFHPGRLLLWGLGVVRQHLRRSLWG